jgi:hypothetical protein
LAEREVSLATVFQAPKDEDSSAQIILTTHQTNEHSIQLAIEALKQLPGVKESPVLFRMFDPNGFENQ